MHSAVEAHVARHAPVAGLQVSGGHTDVPPSEQVPVPLQRPAAVELLPEQAAGTQMVLMG